MALLFSKIDVKATMIATSVMIVLAIILSFVPWLSVLLLLFATIPGIVLWHKSIPSFGMSALITVIITTLTKSVFALSIVIIIFILSAVIGQLLKERASKERIFYLASFISSLITLVVIMILQSIKMIPLTYQMIKPLESLMKEAQKVSDVSKESMDMLENSIHTLSASFPSFLVLFIIFIVFLNLLITFPMLREFKIATPSFKPLYSWEMNRSFLWIYFVVLLGMMFTTEINTWTSILLNLQVMLQLVMFIQGLSLIHYFAHKKRFPTAVSVIFVILGVIFYPITRLIGMLDLGINLKGFIKK
ncbi:DUF2232 domain-containing protein [Staphylococcus massiliensis]|uniref:DUF2232 domain-containing protein n=1 Tax=Staphylococcus massiliensis TaxID=555791 RepID=UPI001EDFCB52